MTPAWKASPCKWLPVALSFHDPIRAVLYGPVKLSARSAQEEELKSLDEVIDHQTPAFSALPGSGWPEAHTVHRAQHTAQNRAQNTEQNTAQSTEHRAQNRTNQNSIATQELHWEGWVAGTDTCGGQSYLLMSVTYLYVWTVLDLFIPFLVPFSIPPFLVPFSL